MEIMQIVTYMTEENTAEFRQEGEVAFPVDTENENSESSGDEKNETDGSPTDEGQEEKHQDTEKKPLNEHPRWQEREKEWNTRFSTQEAQHKKDMEDLRNEFGTARKENANQTEIPSWFGGTPEQWNDYRRDRDAELTQAEERAKKSLTEAKEKQDKAVKEATDYMHTEVATIEADQALNPTGGKIDQKLLLKIVLDNDLVDLQGRWNYKAGMRIYNSTKPAPKNNERKAVAAATNSESKPESKPSPYKSSKDFKGKNWGSL